MKDSERPEIFRGHLEECLRQIGVTFREHFPKGAKGTLLAHKPVADFCGVSIHTVSRWFYEADADTLPTGEALIKIMFYLDMVGYRVIELERMQRVRRNFGELIGYGLLTSQKAADLLGYATPSALYVVMWGKVGVSEEKEQKMWDIWKERKEELARKKEQEWTSHRMDLAPKPRSKGSTSMVDKYGRTAAVCIMEGLLALLEKEPFDEKEFVNLQQVAGEIITRLSAHLNVLHSKLVLLSGEKEAS